MGNTGLEVILNFVYEKNMDCVANRYIVMDPIFQRWPHNISNLKYSSYNVTVTRHTCSNVDLFPHPLNLDEPLWLPQPIQLSRSDIMLLRKLDHKKVLHLHLVPLWNSILELSYHVLRKQAGHTKRPGVGILVNNPSWSSGQYTASSARHERKALRWFKRPQETHQRPKRKPPKYITVNPLNCGR